MSDYSNADMASIIQANVDQGISLADTLAGASEVFGLPQSQLQEIYNSRFPSTSTVTRSLEPTPDTNVNLENRVPDGQDAGIPRSFYTSSNTTSANPTTVEELYQQYLGRAPDKGGLEYWQQQLGDALDPNEIERFKQAAAPELAARNNAEPAPNTPASVDPLYQMVVPVEDYGKIPRSFYTSGETSKSSQAVQPNNLLGSYSQSDIASIIQANIDQGISLADAIAGASAVFGLTKEQLQEIYGLRSDPFYKQTESLRKTYSDPEVFSIYQAHKNSGYSDADALLGMSKYYDIAPDQVAAALKDFQTTSDPLFKLYQQELGRKPDEEGLKYWRQQFGDTIDPNEIAQFKEAAAVELYGPNYNNPDKPYFDYFKTITPSGELTPGNFGRQTALDLAYSGKLDQDSYTKVLQNSSNRSEIESILGLGKDILDKAPKNVDPSTLSFAGRQGIAGNAFVDLGNGVTARYDKSGNLQDFSGPQVWPLAPDGQGGYKTALPKDTIAYSAWKADGSPNPLVTGAKDESFAAYVKSFGFLPDIGIAIATAGSSLPVQLASKAALDLARGATPAQVLQGGISSYLAAGIADYTGLSDAIKTIDNPLLRDTLTGATRGGLSAAVSGGDIGKGITVGAVSSAVSNLGTQYLSDTSLTAVQRNALMSSATAYAQSIASGQSGDVALKNAFMAGGKAAGTQFAKDIDKEYGITDSLKQSLNPSSSIAKTSAEQSDKVSVDNSANKSADLAATAFVDARNLGATEQEAKKVADSVAGTTNTASENVGSINEVVVAPDVQVAGNYMPEIPQPKAGQLMVDSTGRPISIGVISYDSSGKGQLVAAPITGDQTSGYSYEVNGKPQNLTQEQYERVFSKTNPSEYLKMAEKMYATSGDLDAFNKAFGVKESAAKPVTTIDVEAKEVPAAKSNSTLLKDIISKVGGLDAVEIGGALAVPEVADIAKKAMDQGFAKDIFDQLSQYPSRDDEDTRYLNELYKNMTGDYVPGTPDYNYAHRSELKPVEVTSKNVEQVNADILDNSFISGSSEGVSTNTNQDINQTVINAASSGANPATVAQEVSKADPNINVETGVDPQTGATSVTTTNANNNTVTTTQTDGKTQTTTNVNNNTGITTSTSSGGSGGTITTTVTDTVSGGGAVITKDPVTDKIVAVETTGKNVQVVDSNTVVIDDKKIDVSTGTVVNTTATTGNSTTAKTTGSTPKIDPKIPFAGMATAAQSLGDMSFLGPQFLKTRENKKQFIDPLSLYRGVASAEGIPMQQISPQMPSDSLDKYYNYGKAESIDDILGLNKKDDKSGDSSVYKDAIDNLLNVPYAAKEGGLVPPLMAAGGSVKVQKYAQGGLSVPLMNHGGKMRGDFRHGAHVAGPGDGQSDDIPAMLADGEYVLDSEIVAALGNGSTKAGSQLLDKFRQEIRTHKRSGSINSIPPKSKSPLQYLSDAKKKLDKK